MLLRRLSYLRPRLTILPVRYTFCCQKGNNYPTSQEEKKNLKVPLVADSVPKKVELEVGKNYHWCSCGLSSNQPFCDGSHKGTIFKPTKFTADNSQNYLCMCKLTQGKPFCDGSHKTLNSNNV